MSEGFKRIVKKAGIDPMTVPGKGLRQFTKRTFHSLRHSFNSALANAGVAEEIRMKLTEHQSRPMNECYTHLQVATLKSAVGTLRYSAPSRTRPVDAVPSLGSLATVASP